MWNILQLFYDYLNQCYSLNNKIETELQSLKDEVVILKNKIDVLECNTQEYQHDINELFDLYNSLHLN